MPAIGLEAEFNVWMDGREIVPEKLWRHPREFIHDPLLHRTGRSSQIPAGGAVYFDRGVIEVVTPLIEIAPGCAARAVRSLWEQIGYVRGQLDQWEGTSGHQVRLRAYSTHYNVSFDVPRWKQRKDRNIRRLALLLAYIVPIPLMLVGANRRSTGIGVRPRGNRVEITADFTPDPALMIVAATLIVGIVREVMSWPSYRLGLLREIPVPTVAGVIPGRHTSRKGWLTKDFHYAQSPYGADVDARIWPTRDGRMLSLRRLAVETVWFFRKSIRRHADPFTWKLLFSILEGETPSLLELDDRPRAYDDVGRLCRWGMVIDELRHFRDTLQLPPLHQEISWDQFVRSREAERQRAMRRTLTNVLLEKGKKETPAEEGSSLPSGDGPARARRRSERLLPDEYLDRRRRVPQRARGLPNRRAREERRVRKVPTPFPDRRLQRSAYEQVFLQLVSGRKLRIGAETFTPIGMKGWYHALFRSDADGRQRILTIDQLLRRMQDWV
ncbi:MAG TPA: hypothetical protein VMS56_08900 [Thermoanaerobaculia bacterium]|nr:hypothetical protein [Thermoanaerobaculia bacterium]